MKWKLLVGAGLTATALLSLDFSKAILNKAVKSIQEDYSVEMSGTSLSLDCLVRIIEKITSEGSKALGFFKDEFKAERLEVLRTGKDTYSTVVTQYLAKQEDILRQVTDDVLESFQVSEELFEKSLNEHYSNPLLAKAMDPKPTTSDAVAELPSGEVFIDILHTQLSLLRDYDERCLDITPAEYIECEFRLEDEIEVSFGVGSASFALGRKTYQELDEARTLLEGIDMLRKKLVPATRVGTV